MSQLKLKKYLVNECTKHAKSVHAFVMREALPIPFNPHREDNSPGGQLPRAGDDSRQ